MTKINDVNKYIDHTLLKAEATEKEIIELCAEAKDYDFKSVCVNPIFVKKANEELSGTNVLVCTVVGFPLGANTIDTKKLEAIEAIQDGAKEIDMVINIGKYKSGDKKYVEDEIKQLVAVTHDNHAILKVIIETSLLSKDEIEEVTKIVLKSGADFVKTSTGFSTGGAQSEDIRIMKAVVGNEIGIKASGGIKTWEYAKQLIELGATRIGASSGRSIVDEAKKNN